LIDGIPDCSGVMPPESGITIEGETPAEGEAPADSAPPPAG
jgi:hypothetical protein